MTIEMDILLGGHTRFRCADGRSLEDMNLCLDDIDASHFFRDRMFHLNTRIDFDEVEFARIGIHQEFDRASADIIGRMRNLQTIARQFLPLLIAEIGRGRPLHDLLITALDRAVTLEKMHGIAMCVTKNLHLDMAGALHELFQIDLVLAKSGLRLAPCLGDFARKVCLGADRAHTAAAAAPACFQHQRIADLARQLLHFLHVVGKRIGCGHDRHANFDGEIARCNLVAKTAHGFGFRADKNNAVLRTGFRKFRAFGQQPIARMDSIGTRKLCDANNLINGKIAFDRTEITIQMWTTTNLIALIRLEAVQGKFVFLSPYSHRFEPQLIGGAEYADCNF